ncbi:glutamine--fructose-6-phosphate transaminase (isomerizing) [Candidatus Gracilibacteria bacterium]|nr:glutamine--fructose-6-phosphate transaminase (isomerizing) [Candidatus Gracilibacteria bacterium]
MCGIFAVSGKGNHAGNIILEGLKKLEYRGYDSWGIALRKAGKDAILIEKEVGKISKVNKELSPSVEGIGHSRWATHGGVTRENAHPHQVGKVTIVHNGIFENFSKHKKQFEAKGTSFCSQTDSEVIAAILNSFFEAGFSPEKCITKTAKKIDGRFAFLAMFEGISGIFAARRGSPLIIGRGKTETFIASDIPAFLEKTNIVNYLDDNEMVLVNGTTVNFKNLQTGLPVEKRDIKVPWKVESAEKGKFPHFMIKEIFEQKETIARAINHDENALNQAISLLKDCNGVFFVACGTAHKVAMTAEYFFAEISGRKINVVPASEMPYFERFINKKTAIIAISQSGETADVLEVLERGKKAGAKILSLTNVESSSIARLSDVHIPILAGPEKAVASTKAATSQMALLFLLAYTEVGKTNIAREILRSTSSSINDFLNERYEAIIQDVAKTIVKKENLFIIGRGDLYPMALEAAIKIQEVSYIHAQGFSAGELKHGPIALIEKDTPCLVLGDDLETLSNAVELKSRGAKIIGISPQRADVFDEWLKIPDCDGAKAIVTIIPVQILAYHLALLRNIDPDMPRNLAKSVTVK